MTHFDKIDDVYAELPYMKLRPAEFMRDFIAEHDIENILEIGFYHGKSSAYFAAILEDRQKGHLTTIDKNGASALSPTIFEVLSTLGLSHRVKPIVARRSYTWEMKKLIEQKPRPQFDLCYFDGGHVWDATGFGFLLVDMLLRPGGWIIFDDMDWTPENAIRQDATRTAWFPNFSEDELRQPAVRLVFETLVPHLGYLNRHEAAGLHWGIAQKPSADTREAGLQRFFTRQG